MRPIVRFLDDALIERIVAEARSVLRKLGVEIANDGILRMLGDHGAHVEQDSHRVFLTDKIIDRALETKSAAFRLYDVMGRLTHDFSGNNVHFTPGSAAINILDGDTQEIRPATTVDYVRYAKLMSRMDHIASQSTALVPSDVPDRISDSYRLFLSLVLCEKPVVTGAFTVESFEVMKDLQLAVRGSQAELKAKPLTVFSCCPTAPLKWSHVTSQNVVDCARYSIPVEYVSMPLAGFVAPVTLVGSLVQHTAETLTGIVISQLTNPGAPALYGGSPAIFDVRYETTPMGAIETMMMDCAYNEIGKHLGLPTQAYISLSDAKQLDAQAGLETSMGATLAALSGINNISGPGMLDFESCLSLEKLVLDNEICGMMQRIIRGIEPQEDFPAVPRFEELLQDKHLLISPHTRRYLKTEHYFPGPTINRANLSRWRAEGGTTLRTRASQEVAKLLAQAQPSPISGDVRTEMTRLMEREAGRFGMDRLPHGEL